MNKKKMYFKMLFSSFFRRKSRILVALLSVIIGSAIISGLLTIYLDIPRQLGKEFRSYGANFICIPKENKINFDDFKNLNLMLEKEKIVGIAPYRYETTKINQKPYILAGTIIEEAKKNSPFWYIEGEWATGENKSEVMIGKEIARTLSLSIGDTFKISGVKFGKNYESTNVDDSAEESKNKNIGDEFYDTKLTVKGIITTGGREESFIFLDINKLNEIIEDEYKIDSIECSIEANGNELEDISIDINKKFTNISGMPVKRVTQSQDTVLSKLNYLILLVSFIILILTIISVSTTMMAIITERRKEIGLKKALGAQNREIVFDFIGEGVVIGFMGSIFGMIFGFFLAQRISLSVFGRLIEFQYFLIPIIIILSVFITIIGCIIPVKNAVNIDPALVLKGE